MSSELLILTLYGLVVLITILIQVMLAVVHVGPVPMASSR